MRHHIVAAKRQHAGAVLNDFVPVVDELPRIGQWCGVLDQLLNAANNRRALEMALRGDVTHDAHGVTLGLAYYFDNKATLLVRDRELRY